MLDTGDHHAVDPSPEEGCDQRLFGVLVIGGLAQKYLVARRGQG